MPTPQKEDSIPKRQIAHKLRTLGARGALFQAHDVYEAFGLAKTDKRTMRLHAAVGQLYRKGALEAMPGRKLHKWYKLASPEKLDAWVSVNGRGRRRPVVNGEEQRPLFNVIGQGVKSRLDSIDARLEALEAQLAKLIELWQ